MKFTTEWLGEWMPIRVGPDELAATLTMAGLEVDDVAPVAPRQDALIARVETVNAHPDSDRLKVCRVSFGGTAPAEVVCGAPNVSAGRSYPYVMPGTQLPDGKAIVETAIRGVRSSGMLCSAAELGISDDAGGLLELPADAPVGASVYEYLRLDDLVFEVGLTPNRGDCLSLLGIARELSVLLKTSLSKAPGEQVPAAHADARAVQLSAPQHCSRYAGRVVTNISLATPTPSWMSERLRRCGVRPINLVVDVTNYVMLELGQPMHAFDLASLRGNINVRLAADGEQVELLDGSTVTLDTESLVIADDEGAIALAGVMGGMASSVTPATQSILLESAWFDPIRLARSARRLNRHTDAAHRFERGVDPALQAQAIERATALLVELCGALPGPLVDVKLDAHQSRGSVIRFRPARIRGLLGMDVAPALAREIFERLGMTVTEAVDHWSVEAPSWRSDLTREVDLIEEIARIVGYDQLPATMPIAALQLALPATADLTEAARSVLVDRGYFEAVTYSFIAESLAQAFAPTQTPILLQNPIAKDMAAMRPSLLPGLLGALAANRNRQHSDVRLFEFGMRFNRGAAELAQETALAGVVCGRVLPDQWGGDGRESDFYDLKQDVTAVLGALGERVPQFVPCEHVALHPGQSAMLMRDGQALGVLGRLHPRMCKLLDLEISPLVFEIYLEALKAPTTPAFKPLSRFPSTRRDLAVLVDHAVSAGQVLAVVRGAAGPHLRDLQLFDVYQGQGIDSGKKSLALGLLFQASSSTLNEPEIEQAIAATLAALASEVGGALRK